MHTQLSINGEATFKAIFKAIDAAQNTLHIQMFIWREDDIGLALALHVLNAADRGVKVTIVKDLMGGIFEFAEEGKKSLFHSQLPLKLRFMSHVLDLGYPMKGKPFIAFRTSHPLYKALLTHPNIHLSVDTCLNDHSKFYIVDDHTLFIGGINVEDKEVTHDLLGRPYHDFMLMIHSEEVVAVFKNAHASGNQSKATIVGEEFGFIMNRFIQHQPYFHAKESLVALIQKTQNTLHIIMAYIGDVDITQAIIEAINRGVQVFLYLPEKANLQNDLNRLHLKNLMMACDNTIKVYLCKDMIHGKLLWFDEDLVTFGSTNLNIQAMSVLQELNVIYSASSHGHQKTLREAIDTIQKRSSLIASYEQVTYNPVVAWIESKA